MKMKDKQKINSQRKREIIEKAEENGSICKATKMLSAIYLLHSQSAVMYNDLDELLAENGLKAGRLKWLGVKLDRAFNEYFGEFSKMISKEQTLNWASDLDKFGEMFKKFANYE